MRLSNGAYIDDAELIEKFIRSSGPGGQNVNKVSTAVELRFDVTNSTTLDDDTKAKILAKRDRRISNEGVVVINAQRFRSQDRNREDARERLLTFLNSTLVVQKKRVATKPSKAAKARRLQAKKERSDTKSRRNKSNWD